MSKWGKNAILSPVFFLSVWINSKRIEVNVQDTKAIKFEISTNENSSRWFKWLKNWTSKYWTVSVGRRADNWTWNRWEKQIFDHSSFVFEQQHLADIVPLKKYVSNHHEFILVMITINSFSNHRCHSRSVELEVVNIWVLFDLSDKLEA